MKPEFADSAEISIRSLRLSSQGLFVYIVPSLEAVDCTHLSCANLSNINHWRGPPIWYCYCQARASPGRICETDFKDGEDLPYIYMGDLDEEAWDF